MATPKPRATYNDLYGVPEHMNGEILDGELFTSPRPAPRHARAATILGSDLCGAFDGRAAPPARPGGWFFLVEPEIYVGDDVLVPDLAAWRTHGPPPTPRGNGYDHVPDWLCEVVSPSTGALDRGRKLPIYARGGVSHVWLVDPVARTLEVYILEAGRWVVAETHAGTSLVRAAPFAAIGLDLARLWLD